MILTMGHDERSAKFTENEIIDPLTASDWKDPPRIIYEVNDIELSRYTAHEHNDKSKRERERERENYRAHGTGRRPARR